MSTIRILAAPLTVVALALPGAAAATAPAADPPRPAAAISAYAHNYGAISLAMTGRGVGWSYDYPTKRLAGKWAQYECKEIADYPWTCKKIAWVRDGCLAVAARYDGIDVDAYGWGSASTKRGAYQRALAECGYGCKRRAWTCTTR